MDAPRVKWDRLRRGWKATFPWIAARGTGDDWGVGCEVCAEANMAGGNPFALFQVKSYLQDAKFRTHERSKIHKLSLEYLRNNRGDELARADTPTVEQFQEVLDSAVGGSISLSGSVASKKLWCLSEAIKAKQQAFWRESVAVTLLRDERKGALLHRFVAANANMEVCRGTFGQHRGAGTGATNITQATDETLRQACSRFHGAPHSSITCKLDKALYRHVCQSITGICVDSAGHTCHLPFTQPSPHLTSPTRFHS